MPQDASLRDLYLEMLTSQVAGLYDDTTKKMYVVTETGEIGPAEEITYAHEYTHALQDQAFDTAPSRARRPTTRATGRSPGSTLIEGDATLLMSIWAQQHLHPGRAAPGRRARATRRRRPCSTRCPRSCSETLLFPYTQGLTCRSAPFTSGGGYAGVDALFANPPESTEQVLHPEKLPRARRRSPVAFPDDLADAARRRLVRAARGHAGRAPAADHARRRGGVDSADGRRPPRPAGAATGSR